MSLCPCGSTKTYQTCCSQYIDGAIKPLTAEALMRSRYTAYSMANIDYIDITMRNQAKTNFNKVSAFQWAKSVIWLDLKVLNSKTLSATKAEVEFVARFIEENRIQTIHEISEFNKVDEIWYYTDGRQPAISSPKGQKVFGNAPCPCGSRKTFKVCHGNK